jgi:hypothetical protein
MLQEFFFNILQYVNLPLDYWAKAIATTTYIQNKLPTKLEFF